MVAAALVIQGSACIYSKKVEHLYELVYNVLNQVVDEKKKREGKQKKSVDEEGKDKDAEELTQDDAFLTLDDDIKEVDNFMLPTVSKAPDSSGFTLVRTPLTLLPVADKEDAGCKMGSCELHASGAPLPPAPRSAVTLCASRAFLSARTPPQPSSACRCSLTAGALLLPFLRLPSHMLAVLPSLASDSLSQPYRTAVEQSEDGEQVDTSFSNDDDTDMGPADEPDWEEKLREEVDQMGDIVPAPDGPSHTLDPSAAAAADDVAPPPSPGPQGVPPPPPPPPAAPTFDHWAPLDPHDAMNVSSRPFRRGRTYNAVPESAGNPTDGDEGAEGEDENASKENASAGAANRTPSRDQLVRLCLAPENYSPGSMPLKQPLWAQFELLHTIEAKRRTNQRRLQRQKQVRPPGDDPSAHAHTHTPATSLVKAPYSCAPPSLPPSPPSSSLPPLLPRPSPPSLIPRPAMGRPSGSTWRTSRSRSRSSSRARPMISLAYRMTDSTQRRRITDTTRSRTRASTPRSRARHSKRSHVPSMRRPL